MNTKTIVAAATAICVGLSVSLAADDPMARASVAALPKAVALPAAVGGSPEVIRFLEDKVRRDPEDMVAQNKLVGAYLQRLRETGDIANLKLAADAAKASLAILPAERNLGGLSALAQVQMTGHDFATALQSVERLNALDPKKSYVYQMMGDALFEMGRYAEAEAAFQKMADYGEDSPVLPVAIEQRKAKFAFLRGDYQGSREHLLAALRVSLAQRQPNAEMVAATYWHLGDQAFDGGEYELADRFLQDSLVTFPNYVRSLAVMGQVRATRGDFKGALPYYEKASAASKADLVVTSQLADVYRELGRTKDADAQMARALQIVEEHAALGAVYRRERAQFLVNHDVRLEEAYELAKADYVVRHDVGGADVLAWTAYKTGRLAEAQEAMKDALQFNNDAEAPILFHAGVIARKAGQDREARAHLTAALKKNPTFDREEAAVARTMLQQLN